MSENMKWEALEILVAADATEAVEFAMGEIGTLGTCYSILARPDIEKVLVSGYFESRVPDEAIDAALAGALEIFGASTDSVESYKWNSVEEQDWLAEWKKYWKSTITERFIVAPPWEDVDPEGRIVIRIEPGMAFGTGTHETTRLCLKAIERLFRPGMSVLDVGTGTGVLVIAAAMLGGKGSARFEACDIDSVAVETAKANAEDNGLDWIEFRDGTIEAETQPFDLVCANLTLKTVAELLPLLYGRSRQVLLLSGILGSDLDDAVGLVLDQCAQEPEVLQMGEWVALIVRRSEAMLNS